MSKYPDRFSGLAGVDPFRGVEGLRDLDTAVKAHGFVGAHLYPHWFKLAPDHALYYPYYARCCELDIPIMMQVGQNLIYQKEVRLPSHTRAYLLLIFGFALLGSPFNVALLWARPYLSRRFAATPAEGAYIVGLAMIVFATAGILVGSRLSDRITVRGDPTGPVRVGMISAVDLLVPALLFPLAPSLWLAAADLSALLFAGAFAIGCAPSALQAITPNRMRATVSALYLLVVNLVGLTAGPVATGALTDYVFQDKAAVGWSAAIVSVACALLAVVAFAAVDRPYRQALEREAAAATEAP